MRFYLLSLFILYLTFQNDFPPGDVYIRCNQVGYLPGDLKSAVIFSENPIEDFKFSINDAATDKVRLTGYLQASGRSFNRFKYFYNADFSAFSKPGEYIVKTAGSSSTRFRIGSRIYNDVVDSLMLFFRVQRCGPTAPVLHRVCHLWDIARLEGEKGTRTIDVTGGWQDAGDYLKFVSTAAYTTYLVIFA